VKLGDHSARPARHADRRGPCQRRMRTMSRFDRLAAENDPADAADAVRPLADALSASDRKQFWISSTRCQWGPPPVGFPSTRAPNLHVSRADLDAAGGPFVLPNSLFAPGRRSGATTRHNILNIGDLIGAENSSPRPEKKRSRWPSSIPAVPSGAWPRLRFQANFLAFAAVGAPALFRP
jgi:hypothetical protein